MNGREIGRETRVPLPPGAMVDLSGQGADLVFQVSGYPWGRGGRQSRSKS